MHRQTVTKSMYRHFQIGVALVSLGLFAIGCGDGGSGSGGVFGSSNTYSTIEQYMAAMQLKYGQDVVVQPGGSEMYDGQQCQWFIVARPGGTVWNADGGGQVVPPEELARHRLCIQDDGSLKIR